MGESMKADPEWISGLGNHLISLSGSSRKTVRLIDAHAKSTGEFKGLMGILKGPVDQLEEATSTRVGKVSDMLSDTGVNVKQAAWAYTSTERDSKVALEHTKTVTYNSNPLIPQWEVDFGVTPDPRITFEVVDDVPETKSVGQPSEVDVSPPPKEDVNWESLIDDTAGWLGDADGAIRSLTGWSPIEHALEPISGNWMELKRIGKTYGKSGNAFDAISGDLGTAHRAVDSHWDGRAAVAYADYSAKLARNLNWEGSTARLLERGLVAAADQLEKAARKVIDLVKEGLSRILKVDSFQGMLKLAAKAVPGVGTAAAVAQVTNELAKVAIETNKLIKEIQKTVEALQEFIEFYQDPIGFAKNKADGKVQEKLKPFTDVIEDGKDKARLANDVATAVDLSRVDHRPGAAYEPGNDQTLWEDAK